VHARSKSAARTRAAIFVVTVACACVPDLALPVDANLRCFQASDCANGALCTTSVCPVGATCNPLVGTCLPPGLHVALSSGDRQEAVAGTPFLEPLALSLTDANGQPVAGLGIAFASSASGPVAQLTAARVATDASGRASNAVSAGAEAGTYVVVATLHEVVQLGAFTLTNCAVSAPFAGGHCGMLSVPGGPFPMGCNAAVDDACDANESPPHEVTVSPFLIDATEVTQDAYRACVTAGVCSTPGRGGFCNWEVDGRGQHPVNCVDWGQATTYCAWARRRLPTEAEWQKAARGTDGRRAPWGNAPATCDVAVMAEGGDGCGTGGTLPVGSKPKGASPYGAQDMVGNVWEWVADWYGPYSAEAATDPKGPAQGSNRVDCGGGWRDLPARSRASARYAFGPSMRTHVLGFRCAHDG
jgi:iron(II)-dependent oxidoreductase